MNIKSLGVALVALAAGLVGSGEGVATWASGQVAATTEPALTEEQAYANLRKTGPAIRRTEGVDEGPIDALSVQSDTHSGYFRPLIDDDLRSIGALKHLQSLAMIDAAEVTDRGMAFLGGLKELKEFSLDHSQVTGAGLSVLADLPKLSVVELTWDQKIDDRSLLFLDHMVQVSSIDLSNTSVTGAGLKHLESLKNLGDLSLNDTKVKDGLEHLNASSIAHLLLVRTGVDDDALKPIEKMTHLRGLDLTHTHITDAGLVHLEGLNDLQELILWNTNITDAGLVHLKGLPHLVRLDLNLTRVTSDGIETLHKALPECRISTHLKVVGVNDEH